MTTLIHLHEVREPTMASEEALLAAVQEAAEAVGLASFAYSFTAAAEEAATERLAA